MLNKNEIEIKEEQMTEFLADALKKVEQEADPDELSKLKRIFKKCIPLGRRSYVAAYLAKMLMTIDSGHPKFLRRDRFDRSSKPSSFVHPDGEKTERTERPPRVVIDDSLASTIFIGIGRNRHVYPRDLVGLLAGGAGLERERIGTIKVLANYSFIQLFKEDAEKAISMLNGYEYRGRKLSVSYSKQRSEENAADESTQAAESEAALQTENPAETAQEQPQTSLV